MKKPNTQKVIIEDFLLAGHGQQLIQYFEAHKHLCSDQTTHQKHRNLHYGDIPNETIKFILKYYTTKTAYFIDHYFKDRVAPWNAPRICRYTQGESLFLHSDRTPSQWGKTTQNMKYSSLLYLNDDYGGGEIKFVGEQPLKPKAGSNIIFRSDAYNSHEVLKVKKGNRYSIPTWYTTRLSFLVL